MCNGHNGIAPTSHSKNCTFHSMSATQPLRVVEKDTTQENIITSTEVLKHTPKKTITPSTALLQSKQKEFTQGYTPTPAGQTRTKCLSNHTIDTMLYPSHTSFGGDLINSGMSFIILMTLIASICLHAAHSTTSKCRVLISL